MFEIPHYLGLVKNPSNTETVPTMVTSNVDRDDAVKSIKNRNMTANLVRP